MRLSLALLSVWTSAPSRRYSFSYALSNWTRLKRSHTSRYMPISERGNQVMMETSQSKRPRKADPTDTNNLQQMISSSAELQQRSPYEQRMGKIITTCSKCLGEGKVRAPLSKKARARRKRIQQNSEGGDAASGDTHNVPPLMKPCHACDGSGLIAIPPSADSVDGRGNIINKAGRCLPQVPPDLSVAIVGGGIGGIALAAALQHRNIPCIVYERDMSFEERKQGYGLTMQQGARALRSLGFFSFSDNDDDSSDKSDGLSEDANNVSTSNGKFGIHSTRHVVHKPDGTVVGEWGMKVWGGRFEKNGRKHAKRQNAHISRQNLRELLMEMILPDTIQWGHKFVGYSEHKSEPSSIPGGNSHLNLTFRRRRPECEGSEEECEEVVNTSATVIVGCDGIRSAVRSKKLGEDVTPLRYLGCIVILGIAASPNSSLTDGETVFQTADGITRLYAMPFAQPGEEASVIAGSDLHGGNTDRGLSMWQLSFPMDEADAKTLSQLGPSALKAEAQRRCGKWHDPIPLLLSQTPEDLITGYPCYDRSLLEKREFREGCTTAEDFSGNHFVTMLGDAAHPMSPFKGQGANQALLDAVLLARKLYSTLCTDDHKDKIPTALAEFEDEMLLRSAVKVKKSADAAKFLHTHVAISEGNVTRGAAAVEDAKDTASIKTK